MLLHLPGPLPRVLPLLVHLSRKPLHRNKWFLPILWLRKLKCGKVNTLCKLYYNEMLEPEFETRSNSETSIHHCSLTSALRASLQCLGLYPELEMPWSETRMIKSSKKETELLEKQCMGWWYRFIVVLNSFCFLKYLAMTHQTNISIFSHPSDLK